MVQILQQGPSEATLRQQALNEAYGNILSGITGLQAKEEKQALTARQQALQENKDFVNFNLEAMKGGYQPINKADYQSLVAGTYKQEISPEVKAQPITPGVAAPIEAVSLADLKRADEKSVPQVLGSQKEAVQAQPAQYSYSPLRYTPQKQEEIDQKNAMFKASLQDKILSAESRLFDLERRKDIAPLEKKKLIGDLNNQIISNKKSLGELSKIPYEIEKLKSESSGASYKNIDEARKEISGLAVTKEMALIDTAYKKIASAPKTAAGDMSRIFGFMKIQDPTSSVREGEYATAQNAASVPERIRSSYNRALAGEKLTEDQRRDFQNTAAQLVKSQHETYINFIQPQLKVIRDRGLDEKSIIPSFSSVNSIENKVQKIAHPDQAKNARLQELLKKAGQ